MLVIKNENKVEKVREPAWAQNVFHFEWKDHVFPLQSLLTTTSLFITLSFLVSWLLCHHHQQSRGVNVCWQLNLPALCSLLLTRASDVFQHSPSSSSFIHQLFLMVSRIPWSIVLLIMAHTKTTQVRRTHSALKWLLLSLIRPWLTQLWGET